MSFPLRPPQQKIDPNQRLFGLENTVVVAAVWAALAHGPSSSLQASPTSPKPTDSARASPKKGGGGARRSALRRRLLRGSQIMDVKRANGSQVGGLSGQVFFAMLQGTF